MMKMYQILIMLNFLAFSRPALCETTTCSTGNDGKSVSVNETYSSTHWKPNLWKLRKFQPSSALLNLEKLREKLKNLAKRVYSLEQPVWLLSQSADRWNKLCHGICSCFFEKRVVSCWHHNFRTIPAEQYIPNDVKIIDLGMNEIKTLHNDLFKGLFELKEIDLSHNRISYLPTIVFHGLQSVMKLKLDNNRLKNLPRRLFFQLYRLKEVDVSNNLLPTIPGVLFQWSSNLVTIIAHGNVLQSFPATTFHGLTHLEELDLSNNRLCTIDRTAFDSLISLKFLKLDENNLMKLPSGLFANCKSLNVLSIRKNQLIDVKALVQNISSLEYLDLAQNKISRINEDDLANTVLLKELNLHHNLLQYLNMDVFRDVKHLQKLVLSANHLTEFRFNGTKLENLFYLDLQFNMVKQMDEQIFKNWNNLKIVLLQGNMLQTISRNTLKLMSNVSYITLANNMWNCDCDILPLSAWLRTHKKNIKDISNVKCLKPSFIRDHLVYEVQSKDVCNPLISA